MAKFFGFNPPFLGGAQNVLSRQEDERLIKNDYLQLLLTAPGERVMRPSFGTNIRPFLFDLMDQRSKDDLENSIRSATERFELRINIRDIDIRFNDDNSTTITISFVINTNPGKELTVSLLARDGSLVGGGRILGDETVETGRSNVG